MQELWDPNTDGCPAKANPHQCPPEELQRGSYQWLTPLAELFRRQTEKASQQQPEGSKAGTDDASRTGEQQPVGHEPQPTPVTLRRADDKSETMASPLAPRQLLFSAESCEPRVPQPTEQPGPKHLQMTLGRVCAGNDHTNLADRQNKRRLLNRPRNPAQAQQVSPPPLKHQKRKIWKQTPRPTCQLMEKPMRTSRKWTSFDHEHLYQRRPMLRRCGWQQGQRATEHNRQKRTFRRKNTCIHTYIHTYAHACIQRYAHACICPWTLPFLARMNNSVASLERFQIPKVSKVARVSKSLCVCRFLICERDR